MSKHLDSKVAVPANQLNAKVVLGVFERHFESLSWKFLVAELGASTPLQIKKLRQVLKGLVRTRELSLIDGHLYQRSSAAQPATTGEPAITQGEVSKVDGVLKVNRLSIAQAKRVTLWRERGSGELPRRRRQSTHNQHQQTQRATGGRCSELEKSLCCG